jgi:cytohesin
VDASDGDGFTPLLAAVQKGHAAVAGQLLAAGASPMARFTAGWNALQLAVKTGQAEVLEVVLGAAQGSAGRLDVDAVDEAAGETALMMAAAEGAEEAVAALLVAGADVAVQQREKLVTALHVAAYHGHAGVVGQLLGAGAALGAQDANGHSPLHLACAAGHVDVVAALLKAGADVSLQDKKGRCPADLAKAAEVLELLGV